MWTDISATFFGVRQEDACGTRVHMILLFRGCAHRMSRQGPRGTICRGACRSCAREYCRGTCLGIPRQAPRQFPRRPGRMGDGGTRAARGVLSHIAPAFTIELKSTTRYDEFSVFARQIRPDSCSSTLVLHMPAHLI